MRTKAFITTLLPVLLFLKPAISMDLQVEANISTNNASLGETIQLFVKVDVDEQVKDLPWPTVKGDLSAFTITKSTNSSSSSSTTIINGRITKRNSFITQFTYNMIANKAGTYIIGPILYNYNKFSKNLGQAQVTIIKTEPGIKLVPTLSKRTVYVGEQLQYNLRIIPKHTFQGATPPNFNQTIGKNFMIHSLQNEVQPKTVNINGTPTRLFDIGFSMFPLISGTLTIPSYDIDYTEAVPQSRGRSIFDVFGGGRVMHKKEAVPAITLTAKPLPGPPPNGFTGAVGKYTLKAFTDKASLPSGQAMSLIIAIAGDGQPKSITTPLLPDLSNFDVFDPEIKSETNIQGGSLYSSKTFKYVLVPIKKGEYTIGPVKFVYFSPGSNKYVTIQSSPLNITVSKGKEVESSKARFLTQKEIETIGSDIRHINKPTTPLQSQSAFLYKNISFWGLFPISPFLFFVIFFYRQRTRRLSMDHGLRRKVKAKSIARKRLAQARAALKGDSAKAFYHSLVTALERYLSDKTNLEFRGMLLTHARQNLEGKGIPNDIITSYEDFVKQCDFGQYAGSGKVESEWQKAYDNTETLINKLNKYL